MLGKKSLNNQANLNQINTNANLNSNQVVLNENSNLNQPVTNQSSANQNQNLNTNSSQSVLLPPISNALSRITKKPFGIYITPKTSPVQPERFTGYHTGVDFETLASEANIDVPISAVVNGKVLVKQYVSGYGGVLIQSATINNQAVTILYGHLKLASINLKVGQQIKAGDKIGVLGKGYSSETDGERKHLHLGIHIGTSINYKGYVRIKSQLSGWLDAQKLL